MLKACIVPDDWTLENQLDKILEELEETREEVKNKSRKKAAIEAGDIAQAAFTLIHMLGYSIDKIMDEVQRKNTMRGYYEGKDLWNGQRKK